MTASIDTNATLPIRQNSVLMAVVGALAAVLALLMLLLSGMVSWAGMFGWQNVLIAATGLLIGWGGWALLQAALDWDRVVVTLSPEGYRDVGVSPITFPWSAVRAIELRRLGETHLCLVLTEAMALQIERPGLAGRLQRMNRMSRYPTVRTRTRFLRFSPKRLLQVAQAYAAAHGVPQNRI